MNTWALFLAHCADIRLDSVTPTHVFDFLNTRIGDMTGPWKSDDYADEFSDSILALVS